MKKKSFRYQNLRYKDFWGKSKGKTTRDKGNKIKKMEDLLRR